MLDPHRGLICTYCGAAIGGKDYNELLQIAASEKWTSVTDKICGCFFSIHYFCGSCTDAGKAFEEWLATDELKVDRHRMKWGLENFHIAQFSEGYQRFIQLLSASENKSASARLVLTKCQGSVFPLDHHGTNKPRSPSISVAQAIVARSLRRQGSQ